MICFFCGKPVSLEESTHYGLHSSCFCRWFQLERPLEFRNIAIKTMGSEVVSTSGDIISSFFQGKFRKYSAELGDSVYIMKVQQDDFPELPAVEFLSNQIAESLSLSIPQYHLINFHGSITFATRNFIPPGRLAALHHLYHFLDTAPFSCETILKVVEQKTGRLSEMERFVNICLFDSLIGNHDRHGRNLGFIEKGGKYRLSPFYDNPSYIGVEEESFLEADLCPRGRIAVQATDEPLMNDYVEEFRRLRMENAVRKFAQQVSIEEIDELSGWKFLSVSRARAFRSIIVKRIEQLHD